MNLCKLTCIFSLFSSFGRSHIQMMSPPPRRSKYSSYYLSNGLVNYNMNSPLITDGTFPCKGFPKGPPTMEFISNTIRITLEGTATHGGGHCQFGISFDDTNFLVLETVIGTCLIDGCLMNLMSLQIHQVVL